VQNWFVKNLGDAMLALDELERIKALFQSTYAGVECPKEAAAFIRHESEGNLHCEVKVYFSPMSAEVAKAVGAKPCAKPAQDGLSVLAGDLE
jgi:hypothetical protein